MKEHVLINWEINSLRGFLPPTISEIQWPRNSTYGRYCFNFTVTDKRLGMEQVVDVTDYTVFIITNEALFELSADLRCVHGTIGVETEFYDSTSTSFNVTRRTLSSSDMSRKVATVFFFFHRATICSQ